MSPLRERPPAAPRPYALLVALVLALALVLVLAVRGWSSNRTVPNSVVEAINLSCATYGHCATLWRKAECESRFDPNARNMSGAVGLFQFMRRTWATTPYARFPRTSAYASAMAAGWMHNVGRGNEWACH